MCKSALLVASIVCKSCYWFYLGHSALVLWAGWHGGLENGTVTAGQGAGKKWLQLKYMWMDLKHRFIRDFSFEILHSRFFIRDYSSEIFYSSFFIRNFSFDTFHFVPQSRWYFDHTRYCKEISIVFRKNAICLAWSVRTNPMIRLPNH